MPGIAPRELLDEVLIDAAEDVAGLAGILAEANLGDGLDERAKQLGGERRAGVDAGKDVPETGILLLDSSKGTVDALGDVGLGRRREQRRPPSLAGHPEDVLAEVLVSIFEDEGALPRVTDEAVAVLVGDVGFEARRSRRCT